MKYYVVMEFVICNFCVLVYRKVCLNFLKRVFFEEGLIWIIGLKFYLIMLIEFFRDFMYFKCI